MELTEVKDLSISCDNKYTYNGSKVPRVTQIIHKMTPNEALIRWANSLGFKHQHYTTVLNEAATYGTNTHSAIEHILKEEEEPEHANVKYSVDAFKAWWQTINKSNVIRILGQEQTLVCEYFGGTYDLLLEINGVPYLVDFKTSNSVSYRYYLQLAAYSYMLKLQGINIGGVIILQLSKTSPSYNEYVLDLINNPNHRAYFDLCEKTFLSLVYSYYHITYLEENFDGTKQR